MKHRSQNSRNECSRNAHQKLLRRRYRIESNVEIYELEITLSRIFVLSQRQSQLLNGSIALLRQKYRSAISVLQLPRAIDITLLRSRGVLYPRNPAIVANTGSKLFYSAHLVQVILLAVKLNAP